MFRCKLLACVLLFFAAFILVAPGSVFSQGKGGFGKDRKGGDRAGGDRQGGDKRLADFYKDPDKIFDYIAKGSDSFAIAEVRMGKDELLKFAQEQNITDGRLTREQYRLYASQMVTKIQSGEYKPSFGGKGGDKTGDKPGGNPTIKIATDPNDIKKLAEGEFKKRDVNGDSMLNADEMPDALKGELSKWDKNSDKLVNLEEFQTYFASRLQLVISGQKTDEPAKTIIIEEDELDKKPIVFRAGNLPSNLPAWFNQLDTDKDGQVAMFEWRAGSKDLDEFKAWDRNEDSLITAEEVLWVMARDGADSAKKPAQTAMNSPGNDPNGKGGFGKGGFGKGGNGFGGGNPNPAWGNGGGNGGNRGTFDPSKFEFKKKS